MNGIESMGQKYLNQKQKDFPISIIAKLAGGLDPLLPGESADEYSDGLRATILELEAKTPLQIYLAEKIFDCMWWLRRFEAQKSAAIIRSISEIIQVKFKNPMIHRLLSEGKWEDSLLVNAINETGHTSESIVVAGMRKCGEFLGNIDARIADRIKAMQGLQSSYEALVNRRLVIERLRLQNSNMRRDLGAIDSRQANDYE